MTEKMLGLGVLIHSLTDRSKALEVYEKAVGKVIKELYVDDEKNYGNGALLMWFTDDTGIMIFDDGQSCCEHRYMTTGDDLSPFVGAEFLGLELRDGPDIDDKWGVHEVQFLLGKTSRGTFTVETHNEHNGYYGGFAINIREI